MPLQIIRQDITKMECDAIVNATNSALTTGGGSDAAMHKAAGPRLAQACQKLGGCPTGQARLTRGYALPYSSKFKALFAFDQSLLGG